MTATTTTTETIAIPAHVLAELLVWHVDPLLVDDDDPLPAEIVTAWTALMTGAPEIADDAGREMANHDPEFLERLAAALHAAADDLDQADAELRRRGVQ